MGRHSSSRPPHQSPDSSKKSTVKLQSKLMKQRVKYEEAVKDVMKIKLELTVYKGLLLESKKECLDMVNDCTDLRRQLRRARGSKKKPDQLKGNQPFNHELFRWMDPQHAFGFVREAAAAVKTRLDSCKSSLAQSNRLLQGGSGHYRACIFYNQGHCDRGYAHDENSTRFGKLIRLHVCAICQEVMGTLAPHLAKDCPLLNATFVNSMS